CSDSERPVSRSRAETNRPPLIPIRRWMRQTDRSISSLASAFRHAITFWYTLSISVPSRSNKNAGTGGWTYRTRSVTAGIPQAARPGPAFAHGPAIPCAVGCPIGVQRLVAAGGDKLPAQPAAPGWPGRGGDIAELLVDPAVHVVQGHVPGHGGNGRT